MPFTGIAGFIVAPTSTLPNATMPLSQEGVGAGGPALTVATGAGGSCAWAPPARRVDATTVVDVTQAWRVITFSAPSATANAPALSRRGGGRRQARRGSGGKSSHFVEPAQVEGGSETDLIAGRFIGKARA